MKKWPPITEGTLTAAYGRSYKTAKAARQDFLLGKDFKWHHPSTDSTYCSVRDYTPGDVAKIRFNNNRSYVFVTVPDEPEAA